MLIYKSESMMMILHLILVPVLFLGIFGQNYRYITPSRDIICPGQPCFTLHQLTEIPKSSRYFTAGSTFIFLPGNHSLETVLILTNVSDLTLRGAGKASIFLGSQAAIVWDGVKNIHIERLTFIMCGYQCETSSMYFADSVEIVISNSTFQGSRNKQATMNSIYSENSNLNVLSCHFEGNTGYVGGAIESWKGSVVTISGSKFVGNRATFGGAIAVLESVILLQWNEFWYNVAADNGGAVSCRTCRLTLIGNNTFCNNTSLNFGGAVSVLSGEIIIASSAAVFYENVATYNGGALWMSQSVLSCDNISTVILDRNKASNFGGALLISSSSVQARRCYLNISNNYAKNAGGGAFIDGTVNTSNTELSGSFTNNTAENIGGGAVYAQNAEFTLMRVNITGNSETAFFVFNSRVTLKQSRWINNINNIRHKPGGAISSFNSVLLFKEYTLFKNNSADFGGALSLTQEMASFDGLSLFINNTAKLYGGAIQIDADTVFNALGEVKFEFNFAQRGGAVFLSNGGSIAIERDGYLNFSFNTASDYGGGIYNQDIASHSQCAYFTNRTVPYCFIQVDIPKIRYALYSNADSAGINGNFLYGGLLDRCRLREYSNSEDNLSFLIDGYYANHTRDVSSDPYALCFCYGPDQNLGCAKARSYPGVYRGEKLSLTLAAIAQGNTVTSTSVMAITSSTANLKFQQNTQHLPAYCYNLTYNVYSTEEYEEISLYPEGPCHDLGYAEIFLQLTLLPCPDGFILASNGQCVCEERLREYNVSCTIDEDVQLTKKADSGFWMGAEYENGSYVGLILSQICPVEYCRTDEVNMTLHNQDTQCVNGRSGVLCGGCADNFSLLIGSSTCKECSNSYLALTLTFAAAGIALVAFLSILRLTVATGMINSLILYANIVQVNRKLFFPSNGINILTVFIAWLNLDLGFETCFYDGMDAFTQTCLQFIFPMYVWVLISLIIFTSRYSITISKMIGHNPIAVLATLLLMSYAKVLRIIIEVYSSVKLDYSHNKRVTMWLKDANEPYLQSRHLALTVLTSLVLVFLFLPYTLLLLFGHKLYRLSGRKYFHWINKMKPLLDSYYAPYKIHTRYWTGFLLLVRCALYLVFSFSGAREILSAIILTFTILGFAAGVIYKGRIYKNLGSNILEYATYLNLITFSSVSSQLSHEAHFGFVHALVGMVFTAFLGITVYHFHDLYLAKSGVCLKIRAAIALRFQHHDTKPDRAASSPVKAIPDPHNIVSRTVINLREPLLENNNTTSRKT